MKRRGGRLDPSDPAPVAEWPRALLVAYDDVAHRRERGRRRLSRGEKRMDPFDLGRTWARRGHRS
jgi:hypothetical protein